MCFSAHASFAAAAALSVVGLLSLKKAKPKQRVFASMPLLFAVQQAAEGVVWLTLGSPLSLVHRAAVCTFLFFAYVLWPSYLWRALLPLETKKQRKKWLKVLGGLGAGVSAFLLFNMMRSGASVMAVNCNLVYRMDVLFAQWTNCFIFLYTVAVTGPFFISSRKNMWIIGAAILAAMVATHVAYYAAFVSVWCFFAAIISVLVWYLI